MKYSGNLIICIIAFTNNIFRILVFSKLNITNIVDINYILDIPLIHIWFLVLGLYAHLLESNKSGESTT